MLNLHNSMTKTKQVFAPQDPNRVTLYVCGPTVYNYAHIGNFRPAVVFDVLFRLLRHRYGNDQVVYARNFTDIEDKIIRASQESGQPIEVITKKYAQIYRDESAALNILPPSIEPLATDHIEEMQTLISGLLDKKIAYIEQDHILFDVTQFAEYGALANLKMDEMIAGARVEVAPYKRNPADFVLWKPSQDDEPGWASPALWEMASKGRPGWHIECSAMIEKSLGKTIDIHGGGQDLRFPHHENEIAQSVCVHRAPLANLWMHNGFLQMGKDKMSKSIGNVALVRDLLGEWPGEVIRWALLSAQYRQPLEWSDGLLTQSKKQLDRFYRLFAEHNIVSAGDTHPDLGVVGSLEDDMNTPGAMAGLHALREKAGQSEGATRTKILQCLLASGQLMGVFEHPPVDWFQKKSVSTQSNLTDQEIDQLLDERLLAKKNKDYARADGIRNHLTDNGILLEDGPDGTIWRRK